MRSSPRGRAQCRLGWAGARHTARISVAHHQSTEPTIQSAFHRARHVRGCHNQFAMSRSSAASRPRLVKAPASLLAVFNICCCALVSMLFNGKSTTALSFTRSINRRLGPHTLVRKSCACLWRGRLQTHNRPRALKRFRVADLSERCPQKGGYRRTPRVSSYRVDRERRPDTCLCYGR